MKNYNYKYWRIITDIILIVLGIIFLILGIIDFKDYYDKFHATDAEKFHQSYTYVGEDECVFKYTTLKKVYNLLDDDSIIFVGKTTDTWSQVIVKHINSIYYNKTVYYLELDELDTSSKYYQKVLDKLEIESLTSPMIIKSSSDGIKVYTKDDLYMEESDDIPIEYWTTDRISKLENLLK